MFTKSDYLRYLQCPKHLWLYKNKKDLLSEKSDLQQAFAKQGYAVEQLAHKLFQEGVEIKEHFQKGQEMTQTLIKKKTPVIYQATAVSDQLLARADVLVYDKKTDQYDLYEVKSSTTPKEIHLPDLAFQKVVFEKDGIQIGKTSLIHINNEFVKQGEISVNDFFLISDFTEDVKNLESIVESDISKVLKLLQERNEPNIQIVKQCKRYNGCPFIDYCWQDFSDTSIYFLKNISEKKLATLLSKGILDIAEIPVDFPLTVKQELHTDCVKAEQAIIDREIIQETLNKLEYPLYFLDYETYGAAIPIYDGTKPFQQVCFQYSLHILYEDGKLVHKEFLATRKTNLIPELLVNLQKDFRETGNVIVWNQSFEIGRNKEMATMYPEYAPFLENLNSRVFDLMEIFSQQWYVDPAFKGSHSIKKVLPVLVPELSYKDLEIQEGQTASFKWYQTVFGESKENEKKIVFENLLKYCKLDTLAMVEIYKRLKGICKT